MSTVRLSVALLLSAAACSGEVPVQPGGGVTQQQGGGSRAVLASAPVPRAVLSAAVAGGGAETVVFISAVWGSWSGDHVVIFNPRTGESRSVALIGGGFDPVALAAVDRTPPRRARRRRW